MESLLSKNISLIVESNFSSDYDSKIINEIFRRSKFEIISIYCEANGDILFNRFKDRALSGKRHPGHDDINNLEEFEKLLLKSTVERLDIDSINFNINTNLFESLDLKPVFKVIEKRLDS